MKVRSGAALAVALLAGCGGPREAAVPSPPVNSATLALEGKRLLALGQADSAAVILTQALGLDSSNAPAREDLARARYQRAMESDTLRRRGVLREAYASYRDLEDRGWTDLVVYDRLCELAQTIGDTAGFVRYASRAAERFPNDRQMLNLGAAQLSAGRYQEVLKSQKEAIERFPDSPYRSGFYRLLGEAYVRVDRYQTAQRILAEGVGEAEKAVAAGLAEEEDPATHRRIEQDRIAMLLSLQRLYSIYDEHEKLREVERRLKNAGRMQ